MRDASSKSDTGRAESSRAAGPSNSSRNKKSGASRMSRRAAAMDSSNPCSRRAAENVASRGRKSSSATSRRNARRATDERILDAHPGSSRASVGMQTKRRLRLGVSTARTGSKGPEISILPKAGGPGRPSNADSPEVMPRISNSAARRPSTRNSMVGLTAVPSRSRGPPRALPPRPLTSETGPSRTANSSGKATMTTCWPASSRTLVRKNRTPSVGVRLCFSRNARNSYSPPCGKWWATRIPPRVPYGRPCPCHWACVPVARKISTTGEGSLTPAARRLARRAALRYPSRSSGDIERASPMLSKPDASPSGGSRLEIGTLSASRSRTALEYSVRFRRRMTVRPAYGDRLAASSRFLISPCWNALIAAASGRGAPAGGISPAASLRTTRSHTSGRAGGFPGSASPSAKPPAAESPEWHVRQYCRRKAPRSGSTAASKAGTTSNGAAIRARGILRPFNGGGIWRHGRRRP